MPELHFNLNLGYQVSKNWSHNTIAQNSIMAWRGNYKGWRRHEVQLVRGQRNTLLDFYINYKKNFRGHQVEP